MKTGGPGATPGTCLKHTVDLTRVRALLTLVAVLAAGFTDSKVGAAETFPREDPFVNRSFPLVLGERWIGNAVAYGPYRDGQFPGGPGPSRDQIREDLRLIADRWNLIRVYGSMGPTETVLQVIREDSLPVRVLLGAWIEPEDRRDSTGAVVERFPEKEAANRREVEGAIRLAGAYPGIVTGICVGNETQIDWSAHRSSEARLLAYLREVRARTKVAVTTADDRNFWNKPQSRGVAAEVDFIVTHVHPLWGGAQLADALEWTRTRFAEVQAMHPDHLVVLGETGWATRKLHEGEQAKLMLGRVGEAEQKVFFEEIAAWALTERIPVFFFEAFDENWKGGPEPDHAEKHWGLYRADRTPKPALAGGD